MDVSIDRLPGWGAIVVCGMAFGGSPPFADTHLASAIGKRRPVLIVDRPVSVHRVRRDSRAGLRQVDEGMWVLRPIATPGFDRRWLAPMGDRVIARQIQWAADRVLPERRLLVTFSPVRGLLPAVRRDRTVYWRRDLAAERRYVSSVELVESRNHELLTAADVVTGVSPDLVAQSGVAAEAHLVPNGADVEHFSRPTDEPPADLGDGPVIGYIGAVSWRLDLRLISEVAKAHPEWTFVMLGRATVPVPRLPNLRVLGERPYDELPRWVQRFDVGTVPYLDNPFNRASFPLKVFDYLASGVPVVSTPLPAIDDMEPFVRSGRGPIGFAKAIEEVLAAPPPTTDCRAIAEQHSWAERAARVESIVASTFDGAQRPTTLSA